MEPWVGVDLDGTLSEWSNWVDGIYSIGPVVPEMLARIKRWLRQGTKVKIFTARCSSAEWLEPVQGWLDEHGIGGLEITNVKDIYMIELWDDRAIRVVVNQGKPCCDHHEREKITWRKENGKT